MAKKNPDGPGSSKKEYTPEVEQYTPPETTYGEYGRSKSEDQRLAARALWDEMVKKDDRRNPAYEGSGGYPSSAQRLAGWVSGTNKTETSKVSDSPVGRWLEMASNSIGEPIQDLLKTPEGKQRVQTFLEEGLRGYDDALASGIKLPLPKSGSVQEVSRSLQNRFIPGPVKATLDTDATLKKAYGEELDAVKDYIKSSDGVMSRHGLFNKKLPLYAGTLGQKGVPSGAAGRNISRSENLREGDKLIQTPVGSSFIDQDAILADNKDVLDVAGEEFSHGIRAEDARRKMPIAEDWNRKLKPLADRGVLLPKKEVDPKTGRSRNGYMLNIPIRGSKEQLEQVKSDIPEGVRTIERDTPSQYHPGDQLYSIGGGGSKDELPAQVQSAGWKAAEVLGHGVHPGRYVAQGMSEDEAVDKTIEDLRDAMKRDQGVYDILRSKGAILLHPEDYPDEYKNLREYLKVHWQNWAKDQNAKLPVGVRPEESQMA